MKSRRAGLVVTCAAFLLGWAGFSAPGALAAPVNDSFAAAQTIGPALPVAVPASNTGATTEVNEPDIYGNSVISSVWFKWTAPAAGTAVIDLCAAGFTGNDSPFEKTAVRTGASINALALVAETAGRCSLRFNAVAGTNYKIQVDYGDYEGDFTFRLRQLTPPPNDNFASATTVGPALPLSVNSTTVDSTYQAGEPGSLGGSSSSRSVWFNWTPAVTGRVRLDVCVLDLIDGSANKVLEVYTGNTLASLVEVAGSSSNCQLDFNAVAGTTYRIAFSGNLPGEMTFTLKIKSAPAPANDNFAAATVVGPGLPVKLAGNNDFATAEPGEPEHNDFGAAAHSVWYKWTAPATQPVRVRACSRTFSARLGVYTGVPGALTEVGTPPPWGPFCSVVLNAVAGTTYSIAAAGGPQDGNYGPFELDIHRLAVPANDDFAAAREIGTLPASIPGTTVDASVELNENSSDGGSVWFKWTAPSEDPVTFSACSATDPNQIAVFTGTGFGDLIEIDDDAEGCRGGLKGGRLAVAPEAGKTYFISVVPDDRDYESAFTLTAAGATVPPVVKPPVVNPPGFNLKKAIKKCKKIKSKKKRGACIRKAKRTAAIAKCKKIENGKKRTVCIKKARKRFK